MTLIFQKILLQFPFFCFLLHFVIRYYSQLHTTIFLTVGFAVIGILWLRFSIACRRKTVSTYPLCNKEVFYFIGSFCGERHVILITAGIIRMSFNDDFCVCILLKNVYAAGQVCLRTITDLGRIEPEHKGRFKRYFDAFTYPLYLGRGNGLLQFFCLGIHFLTNHIASRSAYSRAGNNAPNASLCKQGAKDRSPAGS